MSETISGQCLCGAVTVTATPDNARLGACHCGMCRKWSGGPVIAVQCAPGKVEAEGPVGTYPSSDWAERAFCTQCGSNLWYRLTIPGPMNGISYVSAGLFEATRAMPLAGEVYIDAKPEGYAFAGDRPRLTEAEVLAMVESGGAPD